MGILIQPQRWTMKPPVGAQINWGHPLANGLANAYLMTEMGGSVTRDFASGRSYAIGSGVTWNQAATLFDGSANGNISNVVVPNVNGTYFYVTRSRLDAAGNYPALLSNVNVEFGYNGTTKKPYILAWSSQLIATTAVNLGQWYQIAAGVDVASTTLRLYVNGILAGSTGSTTPPSGTTVTIGSRPGGGSENLTGAIDYLLCYSRFLSASEVQWLYAEPYAFMQLMAKRTWFISPAGPPLVPELFSHQFLLPQVGPALLFGWPVFGTAAAPASAVQVNRIQTLGVIGEQDDRFMFDTPTGLV